jgi:hypothetical protein
MPAVKLLLKLFAYYAAMTGIIVLVLWVYPELQNHLPIGRVEALLAQTGSDTPLDAGLATLQTAANTNGRVPPFLGSLLWLGSAMLGALLASLPVSWIYINVRNPSDYDQSLVDTIVVLPLVVTSLVVIVQHSLALAFALAGIAGAAQFRNTLKSSGDLLFILLSIAIGLSAGIGAVELALLSTAVFNICFVVLWFTNYGERDDMKRYLSEFAHKENPATRAAAAARSGRRDTGLAPDPASIPDTAPVARDRKMKPADWSGL